MDQNRKKIAELNRKWKGMQKNADLKKPSYPERPVNPEKCELASLSDNWMQACAGSPIANQRKQPDTGECHQKPNHLGWNQALHTLIIRWKGKDLKDAKIISKKEDCSGFGRTEELNDISTE